MRRIIHNTTAIAACLSLMSPHLAMAQTAAPDAGAQEQPAGDAMTCADGTAAPCADATAETPTDASEAEAEAEADAEVAVEPEAEAPVEAEAEADAEAEAEAEAEVMADDAAPAEAESTATAPAAETAPAEQPTEAEAGEAPAQAEPAVTEAETSEAATTEAEAPEGETPTEAAETEAESPAAETEAETEATATPTASEAATDEDALKKALTEQQEAEAAAETEAEAEAAPEAEAEAEAGKQSDATATTTAPEQGAVETEAAKEAAEATETPTAAALNADAGEAEVTEEKVTEENRRSSTEDFATSLRDAIAGASADGASTDGASTQQQEASNDDDDDDNDLAKALLLGLGGVAVGAMLANNRQVALSTPDRVVVTRADGSQQVIKDEVALLRQPGSTVTTENFSDGSSRTIVTRADGSKVVTIRDADLRVLQRTLVSADGTSRQLIDDTTAEAVDISTLPAPAPTSRVTASQMDEAELRAALLAESAADRRFTLSQVRDIAQVRSLVAPVNIDSITFDTGSAAIKPDQAEELSALGRVIRDTVAENPGEMFMIEGYTDTVGSDAANLALSDRRAESVALALTEYFEVPPENLVVQGYGEQFLLVDREGDLRENRRASVRRITELLQTAAK